MSLRRVLKTKKQIQCMNPVVWCDDTMHDIFFHWEKETYISLFMCVCVCVLVLVCIYACWTCLIHCDEQVW
jgi:hypothetical protein